jgi:putative integral membrane protein (TIGR02587 family)
MVSLPLLYTMEVWWAGFQLGSERLLILLGFTFLLLLGYNTYAGVRPNETWAGVVIDSVEELGLGLFVSASFLFMLGRLVPGDSVREVMGKIVVEALLVAIGISIGTSQLSHVDDDGQEEEERGARPKDILGVLSLSACGAVVLATNIGTTDEIVVLALESNSWRLLVMVLVSLLLGAMIMAFSDLLESKSQGDHPVWLKFLFGTAVSYAVAFVCSALILFLFGRFDGMAPHLCVAMTVVLSVAANLGAAAGKILIR